MAIILIAPLEISTRGKGAPAIITGIDICEFGRDFIHGKIKGDDAQKEWVWNDSGFASNGHDDVNLDLRDEAFIDLMKTAEILVNKA